MKSNVFFIWKFKFISLLQWVIQTLSSDFVFLFGSKRYVKDGFASIFLMTIGSKTAEEDNNFSYLGSLTNFDDLVASKFLTRKQVTFLDFCELAPFANQTRHLSIIKMKITIHNASLCNNLNRVIYSLWNQKTHMSHLLEILQIFIDCSGYDMCYPLPQCCVMLTKVGRPMFNNNPWINWLVMLIYDRRYWVLWRKTGHSDVFIFDPCLSLNLRTYFISEFLFINPICYMSSV